MPDKHFTRSRIIAALQELGNELTREGIHGQIFIVGGAAMALNATGIRVKVPEAQAGFGYRE